MTEPILEKPAGDPFDIPPPFPLRHKLFRAFWNLVWLLLASWTPPQMRLWRVFLLRCFGATMGKKSDVRGLAKVWYPPNLTMGERSILANGVICYNMAPITVGQYCVVSQRAFLCGGTHDYTEWHHPLITRPIVLGDYSWICAEAFVGPGATIGNGVVVAARAVANGRLAPWGVYGGNPAIRIRERHMKPVGERK